MTTYQNGEKMAKVSYDCHSETFIVARGIVGEKEVDGDMQLFGIKDYKTEKAAIKAATAWIN